MPSHRFALDFHRVLKRECDWVIRREGTIARARAIVTLADVFAIDAGKPQIEEDPSGTSAR
jgi:hypothetical protein